MRRARAFTLLEVMIGLAILGIGLIALVGMTTRDVRASYRAKMLTVATGLARAKMYDIEEELLRTGFQDTAEHMEGDFSDDGQPRFKWSAEVERVQLPETQQMAEDATKSGDKGGATATVPNPADLAGSAPQGLLGMMGGTGGGQTSATTLATEMLKLYLPLIRPVLENAIRRVTLTVSWEAGKETEKLEVVCFFTDIKAVDQATGKVSGTDPNQNPPASQPSTQTSGQGQGQTKGRTQR